MASLSAPNQNELNNVHAYDKKGLNVIIEFACFPEEGRNLGKKMEWLLGILAAVILPIAAAGYVGLAIWVVLMEDPEFKMQGRTNILISIFLFVYLLALTIYIIFMDLKKEICRLEKVVPLLIHETRSQPMEDPEMHM
ncbi:hypothetical protein Dimus_030927 [Dionaea muscipula]